MDHAPPTLDPRSALEATGQRLGELMFAALTRIDADLRPQPGLARSWAVLDGGLRWRFAIPPGLADQAGRPITPGLLARCLQNYAGSPVMSAFPMLAGASAEPGALDLRLKSPAPYLASDLSLVRYFTVAGDPGEPCRAPRPGETIVGSGAYEAPGLRAEELAPESELTLRPARGDAPALRFVFSSDDNTKVLRLLHGEIDATQYSLSSAKARKLQRDYGDRFHVLERAGTTVSYLAFNMRQGPLADARVRRALAEAIDRESFVTYKMYGLGQVAGSLLSPRLPESRQVALPFDPADAERLLDQAGYPRGPGGARLRLRYKTTPVRDGFEQALAFQSMWKKIGVMLELEVVEPNVFLASVRKGAFELYSSRWIGIGDGSILRRVLRSDSRDDRAGYRNPEVDRLLDQASGEPDADRRAALLKDVQTLMAEDLPYFPLWYWGGALITRRDVGGLAPEEISLSGSLVPLTRLRRIE